MNDDNITFTITGADGRVSHSLALKDVPPAILHRLVHAAVAVAFAAGSAHILAEEGNEDATAALDELELATTLLEYSANPAFAGASDQELADTVALARVQGRLKELNAEQIEAYRATRMQGCHT